jgi:hypothetical protein
MAAGVLTQLSSLLGISVWIIILVAVWSAIWKLLALWKSARKKHLAWFIVLALINTCGILEILYIYVFSNMKLGKEAVEETPKRKVKRRR